MFNLIGWVILGLVAGFIASKIVNKTGSGLLLDTVLGLVGAFIGGWIMQRFGGHAATGLNIYSLVVAIIGALIVMLAYHFIFRRGQTSS